MFISLQDFWGDDVAHAWVKVFRINPKFRILRLTFHRKSALKSLIREIIIASLINFSDYLNLFNHLNMK